MDCLLLRHCPLVGGSTVAQAHSCSTADFWRQTTPTPFCNWRHVAMATAFGLSKWNTCGHTYALHFVYRLLSMAVPKIVGFNDHLVQINAGVHGARPHSPNALGSTSTVIPLYVVIPLVV
ncbi:hypothetical protein KC19_VG043300 [Ceratodon purpureus]|uniref:Uncharacterized protein n=1 Tax=Ceratodon purpureus TaxID=3225 RepID=A0A8T0HLV7_CERPU|nr:hypothetical protein KC19_VG043300 [Ceratodon purpureus]